MEQDNFRNRGRILTGVFLIIAGLLLFAYKTGAPLPGWLFTWPVALIAAGVLIAIKHNLRNPTGYILVIIGSLNLVDHLIPGLNFRTFIAPIIIVGLGFLFIFRPKGEGRFARHWKERNTNDPGNSYSFSEADSKIEPSEFIDSTSIFGGVKKVVLSKNFRFGDVTCFMGGAELNFSQADIKNIAVLDVTQVFGGTKIIVPPTWDVKTEVITIFGGIEDKRPVQILNTDPSKVLILRGTSVFGGIDIRSY